MATDINQFRALKGPVSATKNSPFKMYNTCMAFVLGDFLLGVVASVCDYWAGPQAII